MPSPHRRGPRHDDAASFSGPEQLRRPCTLRLVQPRGADLPSSTKLLLDAAAQMEALAADATDEAGRATQAADRYLTVAERLRALAAADAALSD